ncbi:hypothetical protein JOB18_037559 [Solea senegalensis]|nr:hypothetical protein JOB18_037559 [Solea senegalensis]
MRNGTVKTEEETGEETEEETEKETEEKTEKETGEETGEETEKEKLLSSDSSGKHEQVFPASSVFFFVPVTSSDCRPLIGQRVSSLKSHERDV